MDEDNELFEMFQQIMEQVQDDGSDGRILILSKNPRYAANAPAATKTKNIER